VPRCPDARQVTSSLEVLLRRAAHTADWERQVVHRCAWCQRIMGANGTFERPSEVTAGFVTTDGMCDECGYRALAHLERRNGRRAILRAA
jgi:hypothetical protein